MELLLLLVWGLICAAIANSRGRSAVGWFFIGFFFCFAPVLLLVLPDLKVQEEQQKKLHRENRRLREQLKKDRSVADARHASAAERLTAHDRALGLDTAPPPLDGPEQDQPLQLLPADLVGAQWYFLDQEREQQGPIALEDLAGHLHQGAIDGSTLVWTRSFDEWMALADVPGLEDELRG
jgi:hypothetical protein